MEFTVPAIQLLVPKRNSRRRRTATAGFVRQVTTTCPYCNSQSLIYQVRVARMDLFACVCNGCSATWRDAVAVAIETRIDFGTQMAMRKLARAWRTLVIVGAAR